MSITSAIDPVDALHDIFTNTRQFDELVIEGETTETVPEDEVWIINGPLTVEGTLTVEGELLTADYFSSGVIESGTTKIVPEDEELIVNGTLTVEGTLIVEGEVSTGDYFESGLPEIYKLHETTPKGRQNNRNDALYILESAGTDLNRFGVNPGSQDAQTENGQVQCYIYSLNETRAKSVAQETVAYLRTFLSDNYEKSNFLNIEPTNISDRRASSIARQTDHYVYVVDIQTERLS